MSGMAKLYVVATPIGNLSDISARAAQTLREVAFIAAEDTRVTQKLLNHLEIKKPMVSCYRHNEQQKMDGIIERILKGDSCALCCDAGTPAISDPGDRLVEKALEAGVEVVPVAGPSAVAAALSVSGQQSGRYCFEGFLPMNKKQRRQRLDALENEDRTMVFFEAPHKLKNTVGDLFAALGDRRVTVAREMTKLHEEVYRNTLGEAARQCENSKPRGEYVLVVEGRRREKKSVKTPEQAAVFAKELRKQGSSASAAAKAAAAETGVAKSEIYRAMRGGEE